VIYDRLKFTHFEAYLQLTPLDSTQLSSIPCCHLAFPSVNTIFPLYLMLPSFNFMFSESVDDM